MKKIIRLLSVCSVILLISSCSPAVPSGQVNTADSDDYNETGNNIGSKSEVTAYDTAAPAVVASNSGGSGGDNYFLKDNPVDYYFHNIYPTPGGSTYETAEYARSYALAWETEMDYAYGALLALFKSPENIELLTRSQELFREYAETDAAFASSALRAFSETAEYNGYGSNIAYELPLRRALLYRERCGLLREYIYLAAGEIEFYYSDVDISGIGAEG